MKAGILIAVIALMLVSAVPVQAGGGGFDKYGYNDAARIFNGTGSSWCLAGGQAIDCLGASSADKLVMKWNAQWDLCNAGGSCEGAWTDNEWNGKVSGGSGWVWHYKIVWVGPCTDGATLPDGGYCVWGSYEVLMDHGSDAGHIWGIRATPNGYGTH